MKSTIKYIVCLALTLIVGDALAWQQTGHEVISILATERLTPQAKKQVEKILKGDISKNSLWLNDFKKDEQLGYTRFWHNVTLDAECRPVMKNKNDGLVQLERNIEILRNRSEHSDSLVVAALRTVIHLVPDLHCYAHIRFTDKPKQQNFSFYRPYKGRTDDLSKCPKTTWYKTWAKWYFDMHDGFSNEMFANEIRIIQGKNFDSYATGTPREWAEELGRECRPILEVVLPDQVADDAYLLNLEAAHERCVAKAAVRLAAVLNDIFK